MLLFEIKVECFLNFKLYGLTMSKIINEPNVMHNNHDVAPLLKYMTPVQENRAKLNELTQNWDTLSLLSKLGEAGVNMDEIKNNFTKLSSELIDNLANEMLKKNISEMTSKAQVAVDIVIRNLFERTADIGFLATDEDTRCFLRASKNRGSEDYPKQVESIKERFKEYVAKYSVYFDIVLMNPHGDVLVNIDESNHLEKSEDEIIDQVINSNDDYVETYKSHDFLPQYKRTLVYSYKVTESNEEGAEVLGVLCLCFRFTDEMKSIFRNLINKDNKECITLLNQDGEVIVSSDKYHVPRGATMEPVVNLPYKIVSFGGRDYLAKSCLTNGYQGFYGLGWYGHIMVPLDHAFESLNNDGFNISEELLLAILQNGKQFSQELKEIPIQANSIQYNLNRAIWNGNIKQSNTKRSDNKQFSRSLLLEIRKTGENTKNIIGSSIANLTKTMVLGDTVFLADLIVDIMDRNLYERANDCRWWALTSDFRTILGENAITMTEKNKMNCLLAYINDLYTVYTNLFIYDTNGVIVAVSKKEQEYLIGQRLENEWVTKSLEISDSSRYHVSKFEKSALYDNDYTYIYNAAIRSLDEEEKVVGGIGIVFDSTSQFKSMIEESLPKESDGKIKEGVFAVLATKDQMIISSNDPRHRTGDRLTLDSKYFMLNPSESLNEIIIYNGKYYALGVKCSKGYREYKSVKDDYINNVYSFYFSYISDVANTNVVKETAYALERDITHEVVDHSIDVASFYIGTKWLGIAADKVVESISVNEMDEAIQIETDHHFKGTLLYEDKAVAVIDIQNFIKEDINDPYSEIVIVRYSSKNEYIGILVTSLGDIPEIETNRIKELDEYVIGSNTLIKSVVFPLEHEKDRDLLTILNIQKLERSLVTPQLEHF